MTDRIKAWHFLPLDMCLGYGDGRQARTGETLSVDCSPRVGNVGLHGGVTIMDALEYAAGPVVCRVEIWGDVDQHDGLVSGTHRRVITAQDATETLRWFTRTCAIDELHLWDPPQVVVDYLWSGDESLRVAARYTTGTVTRFAAWDAACDAAWGAAWEAAWEAAWAAAREAARAATGPVTGFAAWDAMSKRLEDAL